MGLTPRHQCHGCEVSDATFAPAYFHNSRGVHRTNVRGGGSRRRAQRICSEVVAGVGDLHDKSDVQLKVLLRFWLAPQLLDYLLALIRR